MGGVRIEVSRQPECRGGYASGQTSSLLICRHPDGRPVEGRGRDGESRGGRGQWVERGGKGRGKRRRLEDFSRCVSVSYTRRALQLSMDGLPWDEGMEGTWEEE